MPSKSRVGTFLINSRPANAAALEHGLPFKPFRGLVRAFRVACLTGVCVLPAAGQEPNKPQEGLEPLAAKEQMIRDRFQRFQDRIYSLSEELSELEPENAVRLARALERAGELGLADKLEDIVKLLDDPAMLHQAVDAQEQWLSEADRLLSILLERDSSNEERKNEIERLEQYRRTLGELLDQQRELRSAAANATASQRMKEQLDQAMKRLESLQDAQAQASEKSRNASDDAERQDAAAEQERLAEKANELAEELKQMSEPPADAAAEAESLQKAREHTKSASESTKSSSKSMSQAGQQMQQGPQSDAQSPQQQAKEALEKAKEQLQEAQKALGEQPGNQEQAADQDEVAEKTKELGGKMQQDSAGSPSGKGKSGKSGESGQQSAQKNLEQAEQEMKDASESLQEEKPKEAVPKQDRAIDQLEEAKRELEEQLQQLRKEEREETLRDLEARFRDMLARQRPINDATVELDGVGAANFARPEQLRLADLAAQQLKLADDASACLHILDEEGTTIAFPHVVGQIADDMRTVAGRLNEAKVEAVTQTIQKEIVDALEQLLEAVKRMQMENEQNQGQQGPQQSGDAPLLPQSAELKLLRASQERVNSRTTVIESSMAEGKEPRDSGETSLKKLASRQVECMDIAKEMRDRKP